jgi:uncharacterized protein with HEPN domain
MRHDAVRIGHMVDAAREAIGYAAGSSRTSLETNPLLVRALVKCIEVVGEAASRVTPETRAAMPAVPWADIVAMRNRLIHTYFDIDLDIVWSTIEVDLPNLLAALDRWRAANPDANVRTD